MNINLFLGTIYFTQFIWYVILIVHYISIYSLLEKNVK